jgi:hypothetical protein
VKKKRVLQWAPCNYRKRENDGCADVWQYLLERTGGTYEGVNDYVSRTTTITLAEGSLVGNGAELERFALESLPLSTMDKMILISILNCPPINVEET